MRSAVVGLCTLAGMYVLVASSSPASVHSEHAACLERRHLPAFPAYDLGSSFDGLPRSGAGRDCYAPGRGHIVGPYPHSVTWTSFVDYGTCTPEGFEGGCTDPLEIQSWPECDRNFYTDGGAKSPKALPPRTSHRLGGSYKIPTAALSYGLTTQLEMFTGRTTIVIFSAGPSLALSAAHALAAMVAPKVSSRSAASLRAEAVSTRGCGRG